MRQNGTPLRADREQRASGRRNVESKRQCQATTEGVTKRISRTETKGHRCRVIPRQRKAARANERSAPQQRQAETRTIRPQGQQCNRNAAKQEQCHKKERKDGATKRKRLGGARETAQQSCTSKGAQAIARAMARIPNHE